MAEEPFDEAQTLIILKAFYDNFLVEWDKYKELAADEPESSEIITYFERLFSNGFQQYVLTKETELYRARIIKKDDWKDTEIAKKQIDKEFYSIILSQDEIDGVQIDGFYMSPENLAYLRTYNQGGITVEQQKKFENLSKKYSKPDFYGFSASRCGLAPLDKRHDGRLSKKTDEYLYLSLERETAIQEMRPIIGQSYNIGVGHAKKDLKLANLRDEELYNNIDQSFEISSILSKISEPNSDVDDKFYYITQILSKYIKIKEFDGILYKSALRSSGSNIMIFDSNTVEFTSSEVLSIKDTNIKFEFVYPFNPKDDKDTELNNPKSLSLNQ